MTTWQAISARAAAYEREKAIRISERKRLLTLLTTNALDPERIGRRVLLVEFLHSEASGQRGKRLTLAERLGVSPARISAALASLEAELAAPEMLTSEADPKNPDTV